MAARGRPRKNKGTALEEHKKIVEKLNQKVKQNPTKKAQPTFQQLQLFFSEATYILEDCPGEKFAFSVSGYVKQWCEYLYTETLDVKFWELYWDALKFEAPHILDSYLIYLEKDRQPSERFYLPRRKCLLKLGLVQAMQELEDDALDLLTLSLPPGTGKAVRNSELILTPKGFVKMGDIRIGDKVIGGKLRQCTVLGVFPQGKKSIFRLTLQDNSFCDVSADHLWTVYDSKTDTHPTVDTKTIMEDKNRYGIPKTDEKLRKIRWLSVKAFEYVGEDDCTCIYVSDETHTFVIKDYIITHNTSLEQFFATWVIGRHPEDYSLFFSHSGDITRMFYDGILNITTSQEYRWSDIFPKVKLQNTDARREQINFGKAKPFASIQCTSVGSKNAGKVRCNRYLYCDDLIGGIEEALNKNYLDKLWRIYGTDARQRKLNGQVKEIHIATRWSVHDVIGRLQAAKAADRRAKFIAVPDIDPISGESNFLYDFNGMTVEFFNDQASMMDDISYQCLYKNEPVEREGLLYTDDSIRRYLTLPEKEPDAILGICDTKNKGTDYFFLPCFYQYGNDYYLVDCICSNDSDYGLQYERAAKIILDHRMQQCEFEANNGGNRVSFEVSKRVLERGGRCNITDKPTETNKETRIIVNADFVKKNVLFKDSSLYSPKSDYGMMMKFLLSYSVVGRNPNDDVPDGLANFAIFVENKFRIKKTRIMRGIL